MKWQPGLVSALMLVVSLEGCTYRDYDGERPAEQVFEVKAVQGAMIGRHDRIRPWVDYRYFKRGSYAAGHWVELHVATALADDDLGMVNFRTIRFTGTAGETYTIEPRPVATNWLVLLGSEPQGYEIRAQSSGQVVARTP